MNVRPACSLLLITALIFGGCQILPNFSAVKEYSALEELDKTVRIRLGEVRVIDAEEPQLVSESITYTAELELSRLNELRPEGTYEYLILLQADQRNIIKDFRPLNAVTLTAQLFRSDTNKLVGRYLFAEETDNTLSSSGYVYSIVKKAIRSVVQ